jgi:hypothetical protein
MFYVFPEFLIVFQINQASASSGQGSPVMVVNGTTVTAPLPSAPPAEPAMVVGTVVMPPAPVVPQQAKSNNPPRVNL